MVNNGNLHGNTRFKFHTKNFRLFYPKSAIKTLIFYSEFFSESFTDAKKHPLTVVRGVIWNRELTMTYSHMGEPHYHWRIGVSLLSSGRDQVGPPSYYRQQRGIEE